jgi:DNA-directed RNA polymerase subunit RPC12/RpoP
MDVIFDCPKCEQELAVDSTHAGSQIPCPACGELIVIPDSRPPGARPGVEINLGSPRGEGGGPVNPIASSAAAKVEMHLRVPVHANPTASLIEKPLAPLEFAAKETDKKLRVKTIRHIDCVEVGHDKFDEILTNFLAKVGESNIVGIHPISYTHLDIGSQKLMNDYGVLIMFRG